MDPNLPQLTTQERFRVYEQLAKTLADLHSLSPSQLNLDGFGNPINYCRRQVDIGLYLLLLSLLLLLLLLSWLPFCQSR
jgi:hypothetical protein